jgi:hypothetical protein
MMSLSTRGGSEGPEDRLLAAGGIHVFERPTPCQLLRAAPERAVKDLGWPDALALEAAGEGSAEVACGDTERFRLEIAAPARLVIEVLDGGPLAGGIPVQEPFRVQARLYDARGRELEVGKFTHVEWTVSGVLEVAVDRSAGEFGFCDTCFGTHGFHAAAPGRGTIEARLGVLRGALVVVAGP